MKKYFYTDGSTKFGPFSLEELMDKNIARDTKIWFYGLPGWTSISEVDELQSVISKIPPLIKKKIEVDFEKEEVHQTISSDQSLEKPKSKKVNFLVQLFIISLVILVGFVFLREYQDRDEDFYNEIVETSYDAEEDFSIYVDKFYRDLNVFGLYPKKPTEVIIKFAKLDQLANLTHYHALSYGFGNDDLIEIYINPSSWDKFNKPKRYFLIYHELAHDILNLEDLSDNSQNKGKLMYPAIESYEKVSMDEFIEAYQELFEEVASK